jgi:hypothetical protein
MRFGSLPLAGAVLAGLSFPALAQAPSSMKPSETVVVIANASGPAIWHATKGDADVSIMGIVQPLPDNFVWNTKQLETILGGARLVLLPPRVDMGVFSGAWFYLTEGDLLHPPHGQTLWDILDSRVAGELASVCQFLHESRDEYSDDSPIRAAMRLGSDFRHVEYLTTDEPEDSIATLARARHVQVRHVASYDLVPSGEELLKLPPAVTGKCVEATIQDIYFQSRHVQAAANAWAIGDVSGMMANWSPPHYYECLVQLSSQATALDARTIDDTAAGVNKAIAEGGQTILVVDIGILLRKDGVLDRLKAEGVSITGPGLPAAPAQALRPPR